MHAEEVSGRVGLSKEDVKAVRTFLPGKLLGRTAALLSLCVLVFATAIQLKAKLPDVLGVVPPPWAYWMFVGFAFAAVVAQTILEWGAARNRRKLQEFAVKTTREEPGYFRIGPYQDTVEDRKKFRRPDRAEEKVLQWIDGTPSVPLYLLGDSGSGKSSLLNAFVLPRLREQNWAVVEARAWQDPQAALRQAFLKLLSRRSKADEGRTLRDLLVQVAKRADRMLVVLDQFEEFVILGRPERHRDFALFLGELQSNPVKGLSFLLVLRTEYQAFLGDIGLPSPRSGENLFLLARFQLAAAKAFLKQSPLELHEESLERLLTSAAELDDTPGLVRPITLNVLGYVLASGKSVAPSLNAGVLVRRYIEQTIEQPAIRGSAPQILELMITEQGTKQPRSERDLAALTKLRPAEVRAVLNCLSTAALARLLDQAGGVWELSHDFIARAVVRVLGRRWRQAAWRVTGYAAPAFLAINVFFIAPQIPRWVSAKKLQRAAQTAERYKPSSRVLSSGEDATKLKSWEVFRDCGQCPEMVVIPGGSFYMGSPDSELHHTQNESPLHLVTISRFAISKYDVILMIGPRASAEADARRTLHLKTSASGACGTQ